MLARAQELSDLLILKNINFSYHNKTSNMIFLEFISKVKFKSVEEIFQNILSINETNKVRSTLNSNEQILNNVYKLVHFGWKKEAIPVSQPRKSLVARFFDTIFG